MNIRRKVFFILDKDKEVKKQLEEIKKANSDDEFYAKMKSEAVENLIRHAKETVPFYKDIKTEKLEDFPIVNKVMMKEDKDKFMSEADLKEGKIRHTSGSTGIPFEIIQDYKKAKRIQAEVIYYREITGDKLGNRFINLESPTRVYNSGKIDRIKQNVLAFDVTKMNDETMEKLHKTLKKNKNINYMMGYASALKSVADYFDKKSYYDDVKINSIVSSSEVLTQDSVEKLEKIFKCKVYDRYSNEDNGFLAQTDGNTHEFIVNRASYFIEILKMDSDKKAEENETGRIVVTDLFNYAQPFIRYDTGDLGAYSYKNVNGANRYVLTKVEGRISDVVYDINDNPISTFAIGNALYIFGNIEQYQLIQEDKMSFTLNIIDNDKSYEDKEFLESLENVLGKGIKLKINYVDNIPTYNSGKFRRIICKYKPDNK